MKSLTILISLLFVSCFSCWASEEKCIEQDQMLSFLTDNATNDLDWVLEMREVAFKEGALKTIVVLDRRLKGIVFTILMDEVSVRVKPDQLEKIEKILHPEWYYPVTWGDETLSIVNSRLISVREGILR
ncbi:hypothetical protein [Agarivorans litoreus]|uniref:hypothetical protein n=1 Tax=Agarivorans litoreus TaxID=1510455 RepID=UPI001C7DDF43|nr:hypothetical protein [Agarivorans litoreus]